MKGKFAMIDGLDGCGKGVAIDAIVKYEKSKGTKIFDANDWWGTDLSKEPLHDYNPRIEDLKDMELLVSSEPTYAGVGRRIRNEYIKKNGRDYTSWLIANGYALDRLELYETTINPARERGVHVVQSRGVITSLIYQMVDAERKGEAFSTLFDHLLNLPGNNFALLHAPSLLLILTVNDIDGLMARLASREKQDGAIFENVEFQRIIKPIYEREYIKELFENRGTEVKYIDAGISIEATGEQAVEIWKEHLKK